MLKSFASRRMDAVNDKIVSLVKRQDRLTMSEEERLKQLDRSYRFWQQFS